MIDGQPHPGPRTARREAREQLILTLARNSFLEKGYAATSMSAIAASVGGSKATLWSHFSSKQDLFAAVLEHATAEYREKLSTILRPSADLKATIRSFTDSYVNMMISSEAIKLHRLVTAEVGRFPEVGNIFSRRAPEPTERLLTDFFHEKIENRQLSGCEPAIMARMLISMCMGGLHQRVLWGHTIKSMREVQQEVDMIVDLFTRAFIASTAVCPPRPRSTRTN